MSIALVIIITAVILYFVASARYQFKLIDRITDMHAVHPDELKTGDIIFTRCKFSDPIPSYLLKNIIYTAVTDCIYTHVGVVYVDDAHIPYIVHYMINNQTEDILSGGSVGKSGLNVSRLDEFCRKYPGNIFIRPISREIDNECMWQFIQQHQDTPFTRNALHIWNSLFKICSQRISSSFFCSSFLMELLIHCGVAKNNTTNYTPSDFSIKWDKLAYVDGYSYGPEQFLIGYGKNNTL